MTRKIIKWTLFIGGIVVAAVGMVLFLMSFVPPIVFREPFLRSVISVVGTFLICAALLLHADDIKETKRDLGTALKAIALIGLVSGGLYVAAVTLEIAFGVI